MTELLTPHANTGTGSYQPDTDGCGFEAEVTRIDAQAGLSWEEEKIVLRRIGLSGAASLVDLGCGPGAFAARVLEAFPGCTVVGVEAHDGMVAIAARRLGGHPRFRVVRTPATAAGLVGDGFDFVVARFLVQHVDCPAEVVEEAFRLLRPGGTLVVIEVDMDLWGLVSPRVSSLSLLHARASRLQRERGGDRTIGRWLYRMLADAGFEAPRLELYAYHSDRLGREPFLPQLDPVRLLPALEAGAITFADYTRALLSYQRFVVDQEAFVLLAGFLAHGRKPQGGLSPCGPPPGCGDGNAESRPS